MNTHEAYAFYRRYIYDEEKQALRRKYNFKVTGGISSDDWELFGAILVGEKKTAGYGSDLVSHEVKSAVDRNSFEYQYHRNHGEEKLREDMELDYHLFISYSPDYRDVTVRRISEQRLSPIFESWLPGLIENYAGDRPKQRYRKSIPYRTVVEHGDIVMEIRGGHLIDPE